MVVCVFDTIAGLPMHPLLVHGLVVFLPLMCLVTIAVAVRAPWRKYAVPVLAANVVIFLLAEAVEQAGKALLSRLSQINPDGSPDLAKHVQWGERIAPLAAGMVVVAVIIVFTRNRAKLAPIAAVLAILGGLVTVGATVYTGDLGARAVWSGTIENTKAP
jgi:hypothetical protein